jgi:Family of unknown function (DUF6338)
MAPTTVQAFAVLILGIAPGFAAIRGYSRRRYRTVPDRDLYALAAAAVVSAIWLGVVWLLLLRWGNPLEAWGLVPHRPARLEQHEADVVLLLLAVICVPYPVGSLAAFVMDGIEEIAKWPPLWAILEKTAFFKPPTAWDKAWRKFTREQGAGEVIVQMEDGLIVRGGFGSRSQADLSPNSPQLYLEDGYGYRLDDDGAPGEIEGEGNAGVYLPGHRISTIYFLPSDPTGSLLPAGAEDEPSKCEDE